MKSRGLLFGEVRYLVVREIDVIHGALRILEDVGEFPEPVVARRDVSHVGYVAEYAVFVGRNLFEPVVVEKQLHERHLTTQRMKYAQPVLGEVEQAQSLHVPELRRQFLEAVVHQVKQLDVLLRRSFGQRLESVVEVLCLPLPVVREIRGHETRHLGYGYRELLHLRAVIDFEVRAGFQPLHALLAFALVVGQRFDRAVGDVEVFEFLQVADLRGQRFEAVAEFAVRSVQRADVALAARRRFEYLILGVALIVKFRGADVDVVFAQREGARPRHLLRRMQQVQVFLVILEPVAKEIFFI